MALFCIAFKRDFVSLLRFPFLNHNLVISYAIFSLCRLKHQYSCFSSYFCSRDFDVLLFVLRLTLLLLTAGISLALLFFVYSSTPRIVASTLPSVLSCSLLSSFLDTYIFPLCRLKHQYSCFPSYFCSRDFDVLLFVISWE